MHSIFIFPNFIVVKIISRLQPPIDSNEKKELVQKISDSDFVFGNNKSEQIKK